MRPFDGELAEPVNADRDEIGAGVTGSRHSEQTLGKLDEGPVHQGANQAAPVPEK